MNEAKRIVSTVTGALQRDARLRMNKDGVWQESPDPGMGTLHLRGEIVSVVPSDAHLVDTSKTKNEMWIPENEVNHLKEISGTLKEMLAILKDGNNGSVPQFEQPPAMEDKQTDPGKSQRRAGRPAGAKNKVKITDV